MQLRWASPDGPFPWGSLDPPPCPVRYPNVATVTAHKPPRGRFGVGMQRQHPGGPARRRGRPPLVLGALLAAVLAGSWVTARGIERDIHNRVTTALGGAPVEVRVAGRDIELTGSTGGDPALAQAVAVAARAEGVRRVSTHPAAGPAVAAGPAGSTPSTSASTGQPSTPTPQPAVPTAPPSSPTTAGRSSDSFPVVRIVYSSGTYSLNRTGMLELNRVAIYLKAHPGTAVTIQGHSDSLGSAAVRKRISLRRAQVAQDYVVSRGITRERTSVQALSDSRPIAPNTTAAGRLSNRRVTIDLEDPR